MVKYIMFVSFLLGLLCGMLHKKQGVLFLAGGGELPAEVQQRFITLAGGQCARIVFIPSASKEPDKVHIWCGVAFHAKSRADCDDPTFCLPLKKATGIWFSGGDQQRLVTLYKNTLVEKYIHDVYARGGVIGGTSAGSSAVSKKMIYNGKLIEGFGLTDIIVDQHFDTRHRLSRLMNCLGPNDRGLGIDEGTVAIIQGDSIEAFGVGKVTYLRENFLRIF